MYYYICSILNFLATLCFFSYFRKLLHSTFVSHVSHWRGKFSKFYSCVSRVYSIRNLVKIICSFLLFLVGHCVISDLMSLNLLFCICRHVAFQSLVIVFFIQFLMCWYLCLDHTCVLPNEASMFIHDGIPCHKAYL